MGGMGKTTETRIITITLVGLLLADTAAHRLVTNSLQVKADRHNCQHQLYDPVPHNYPPYRSNRPYYSQSQHSSGHNYDPPGLWSALWFRVGQTLSHMDTTRVNMDMLRHQRQHLPASGNYYPEHGGGYAYGGASNYQEQQGGLHMRRERSGPPSTWQWQPVFSIG